MLDLSSHLLEIPIGYSLLSQDFCEPIGWYWNVMSRQVYTLTCPIGVKWNISGAKTDEIILCPFFSCEILDRLKVWWRIRITRAWLYVSTLEVPVQSSDNMTKCNWYTTGICSGHQNNDFLASKLYHNFSQAGSPTQLVHFNILDPRKFSSLYFMVW